MISLESYCTLRVFLAKTMLTDSDPRLRRAFNELKLALLEENRRAMQSSTLPALLRKQA